jgi:hypothetical protein
MLSAFNHLWFRWPFNLRYRSSPKAQAMVIDLNTKNKISLLFPHPARPLDGRKNINRGVGMNSAFEYF